jgi:hypothetical protein
LENYYETEKITEKVYQACLDHDKDVLYELRLKEFAKIIKHKEQGKTFSPKWTIVRI